MKFVFAPDSFKGSLTAAKCAHLLENAARKHFPDAQCELLPIADGGEGTVDALTTALGGEIHCRTVTGPAGKPVSARYGTAIGSTYILEMAETSGLPLLCGNLDPLGAGSQGLGELIGHALQCGAKRILLGIGGSGTNDGGMGMLEALGAVFTDAQGNRLRGCGASLSLVEHVDLSLLNPLLSGVRLTVFCDVTNPLLGEHGATAVYGPQKGVTPDLYPLLEQGMTHYAALLSAAVQRDISAFEGAGAAGGVGAALHGVLGAEILRGASSILDSVGLDSALESADFAVTGEGRIDGQSVSYGKAVSEVARRCGKAGIPLCVIAGGIGPEAERITELADAFIIAIPPRPASLKECVENAEAWYTQCADSLFAALRIGGRFHSLQA